MEEWPTIRRFPRTMHEAFPGHGDYAEWFHAHKGIRSSTQFVLAVAVVVISLLFAIKAIR